MLRPAVLPCTSAVTSEVFVRMKPTIASQGCRPVHLWKVVGGPAMRLPIPTGGGSFFVSFGPIPSVGVGAICQGKTVQGPIWSFKPISIPGEELHAGKILFIKRVRKNGSPPFWLPYHGSSLFLTSRTGPFHRGGVEEPGCDAGKARAICP